MEEKKTEKSSPNYKIAFGLGILYIILLGVFTYFFNFPI